MKKLIVTAIFAAVICSITQPGLAADFVFKMAGIQVKKLPADIEKVKIRCQLIHRKADGSSAAITKEWILQSTQSQNGREVITEPFDFTYDNVPQRESVYGSECDLQVYKSGVGWITPKACNQANTATTPIGSPCFDSSLYNKISIQSNLR